MKKNLLIYASTLCAITLTSCGGSPKSSNDVRVFINSGNEFVGIKKDSVWQKIESETGITLNVSGATHGSEYYSNLNLQLQKPASFKYDIVFSVPSNNEAHYQEHIDDDLYWNYDELLAMKPGKYQNIERLIHSDKYKNIQFSSNDGFIHSLLPYVTSDNDWTIYYRSDWLINIGYYTLDEDGNKVAKVPTTITEFTDVMEKFTNNDPDKDPSHKTYGLSPAGSFFYWSPLYHAFGVTPDYDVDETGEISYMYTQEKFRNFLDWAKSLYSKGYIDPNFSANTPNEGDREKFYDGTVGCLITNGEDHVSWVIPGVEKESGAKGNVIVGPAPLGDGSYNSAKGVGGFSNWGGWWGGYSIFKRRNGSDYDTESAFKCLDLLNYLYSQEGGLTRNYGIEGVHYELNNGKVTPLFSGRNDEPDKTFTSIVQEDGSKKLSGFYRMGHAWGGRVDWKTDGTFKYAISSDNVDYELKRYFDDTVKNNFTVSSKLLNFTSYASGFDRKMNLFEDELDTYANAYVRGTSGTLSWQDEMNRLNSTFSWSEIQQMIKEQAKKAGIIK